MLSTYSYRLIDSVLIKMSTSTTTSLPPKLPPKRVAGKQLARVLFPYKGQHEDELSIQEGDIITILSKDVEDQGWWKGELNGRVGVFPDNYVKLIKQTKPPIAGPVNSTTATTTLTAESVVTSSNEVGQTAATEPLTLDCKKVNMIRSPSESKLNKVLSSLTSSSRFNEMLVKTSQDSKNGTATAASEDDDDKTHTPNFASLHSRKPKIRTNKPLCKSESAHEIGTEPHHFGSLLDETGSAKLRHLTATRVKGPRARRPPSLIHLNQSQEVDGDIGAESNDWSPSDHTFDHDDLNQTPDPDGTGDGRDDDDGDESATNRSNHKNTGSANNPRLHSRSNSMSDNSKSSPGIASVPPWMLELKRNQEKKNESRKKSLNGSELESPNKSFGVISTSSSSSPILPAKPSTVSTRNGTNDFSISRLVSPKDTTAVPSSTSSLSRCNSINNGPTSFVLASESSASTDSTTMTKEGQLSSAASLIPPPITACKPARAAKPSPSKLLQQSQQQPTANKDAPDASPSRNDFVTRKEFDQVLKKVSLLFSSCFL